MFLSSFFEVFRVQIFIDLRFKHHKNETDSVCKNNLPSNEFNVRLRLSIVVTGDIPGWNCLNFLQVFVDYQANFS